MAERETPPVDAAAVGPEVPSNRKAMFIVFLVVFIDLLGFGIVLPLLPLYAVFLLPEIFPGNPLLVGAALGLLMASFSLMQFVFAPIWGRISDRIGRRPILLIGLTGSVVFYGLFAYASYVGFTGQPVLGVILILVARIGAGIAGATISTAQAVIADSTTLKNRSRGMALIGAAFGIGFTFGPLLCSVMFFAENKEAFLKAAPLPGATASVLSLLALVLALILLPETLRQGTPAAGRRHWLKLGTLLEVLRMPTIGALVLTFFLATMAFGSLESTLALMNQFLLSPEGTILKLTEMTTVDWAELSRELRYSSLIFAYVGLTLMLVQGLIYRRLANRVGEVTFMRVGTLLMLLGLCGVIATVLGVTTGHLNGFGTIIPVALVILGILVSGFALMTPSAQALISKRADPARQGEILGANQSASALARILGPAIGSQLFYVGSSHVLPYVLGAALMAVVFLLTLRLRQD